MSADAREEVVAYLLGELDGVERETFQARLAVEPALSARVEALRPVVGRLERMDAAAWDAPEPPTLVLPEPERRARPRVARRRFPVPAWGLAAAAALLLAVAVAGGVLLGGGGGADDTDGRAIALRPVDGATGASGKVRLTRDEAVMRVAGLPQSPANEFYELWLLSSPTKLISLGTFRVSGSGDAKLRVSVPVDAKAFGYLDVSLEPADGDPGHSQRSVLRAPTRPS